MKPVKPAVGVSPPIELRHNPADKLEDLDCHLHDNSFNPARVGLIFTNLPVFIRNRYQGKPGITGDSHLSKMQNLMKANGLESDDRTIIDKLKAFDKSTIFSEGKDLVSGIKTVYSFVSKVAELAA